MSTVPKGIADWFVDQLRKFDREADEAQEAIRAHQLEIEKLGVQLNKNVEAYDALIELVRKLGLSEILERAPVPVWSERPVPPDDLGGPNEALDKILTEHGSQGIEHGALLDEFVRYIEAGRVRTKTSDPRKLASTIIAAAVRGGRATRDSNGLIVGSKASDRNGSGDSE